MFSWEYCEIFKNTYFEEHLQTAAPKKTMMEAFCKKNFMEKSFMGNSQILEVYCPII